MFQFQFQTVDAVKASSKIKIDVSGLSIPRHVIRDSIHPAFRVRLQFIFKRVEDMQGGSDFSIRHAVMIHIGWRTHVRSSPQIGCAKVSLGHKMRGKSC